MKNVTSTYGTKKEFLEAGVSAIVTFTDEKGQISIKEVSKIGPCVVRNGNPVKQQEGVRWDHKETLKPGNPSQRQLHSRLQPSWMVVVEVRDGVLTAH